MCGRIVCNLDPSSIQKLCQFTNKNGIKYRPVVRNSTFGKQCSQSYNISPSQLTPVLFCETPTIKNQNFIDNKIIQPMRWGLIPSWYKESIDNFKLTTHNAKIETVLDKATYRSLNKGNRCIVIIEGFYEWNKEKKPYFIRHKSHNILYLAAIFDITETEMGQLYSYSILTEESNGRIYMVHQRSPVILHSDEEIELWLNSENVSSSTAIKYFQTRNWMDDNLDIYQVSTFVNNSANNDPKCIVKVEDSNSFSQKSTLLTRWLKQTGNDNVKEPVNKKIKKDEKI